MTSPTSPYLPSPRGTTRWIHLSIAVLLIVSLGLRLYHLDFESLDMDEIRQATETRFISERLRSSSESLSLGDIVAIAANQQQPPLDYLVGYGVSKISTSDFAVRLPAALFGVGTVFFITLLTAQLCSWPMALAVGFLAAGLPYSISISQFARPYSISIFFLLTVLWTLSRLLTTANRWAATIGLFLLSVCFLHSRTLAPLVVTCVLLAILVGRVLYLNLYGGNRDEQEKIIMAIVAFITAMAVYLPNFLYIVGRSTQYLTGAPSVVFQLDSILKALHPANLLLLKEAFTAQTEPLGPALYLLLFSTPFLGKHFKARAAHSLWWFLLLLLFGSGLLHLFIMQAKTPGSFRPPYAIYLLPLTLILTAAAFQFLWDYIGRSRFRKAGHVLLACVGVYFFLHTATVTKVFYETRKYPDWRGMLEYVGATYGPEQVLVADTLLPLSRWEPSIYGFPRYYRGGSQVIELAKIPVITLAKTPEVTAETAVKQFQPVVILYHHEEYYLTPFSRYPLTPPKFHYEFDKIARDPQLEVKEFTRFSVITLRQGGSTFAGDLYRIIIRVLQNITEDSASVELHLAAARLAHILELPDMEGFSHIKKAKELAPPDCNIDIDSYGAWLFPALQQHSAVNRTAEDNTVHSLQE